jgi:hypothetical protein
MFPQPRDHFLDDTGSTTEAAILIVAFAAFAGLMYAIVTSDQVEEWLTALVENALKSVG